MSVKVDGPNVWHEKGNKDVQSRADEDGDVYTGLVCTMGGQSGDSNMT